MPKKLKGESGRGSYILDTKKINIFTDNIGENKMFNLKRSMRSLIEGKKSFFKTYLAEDVERPAIDTSVIDPHDKKIRVFVFETLMNPEIRTAVLKTDIKTVLSAIPNWKEINVESDGGKDYHTIVPSLGDQVKGMILYVDEEQLKKLDYWEDQYDRKKVILSYNGEHGVAYVYVLKTDFMKDLGQNTSVELNPDDVEQIKWAADNM
jgi:gamma-glutamylcyclotransferase (GGCT)/AIG2-like uncharacterized protein YtfP